MTLDGEPWLCGADALAILYGRAKGNGHQYDKLAADESRVYRFHPIGGGRPATRAISESGLYKLIMRSDKPEAREFQGWVTREVLPAIRKKGGYMTPNADVDAVVAAVPSHTPAHRIELNRQIMSVMAALQAENERMGLELEAAAPKVAFVDSYVSAEGSFSFDAAARTLGVMAK